MIVEYQQIAPVIDRRGAMRGNQLHAKSLPLAPFIG